MAAVLHLPTAGIMETQEQGQHVGHGAWHENLGNSGAATAPGTSVHVTPVKFGSTNSISSSQMMGLTSLMQLFTRGVSFRLSAWLGAAVRVSMSSIKRVLFGDFLSNITPDDHYVVSLRMQPVDAACSAYLGISLVDPMIDLLLGGTGLSSLRPEPAEITEIEVSILASVMQEVCVEMSNAWGSVGIEIHHQQRLLSSYHGQAMPVRDNALCLSFEMQIGQVQGSLQFVFSGLASDALLRAITIENATRAPSPALRQRLQQCAQRFRYGATLQLPAVAVSAHALNRLRPGSVLPLGISADHPAVLMVGGKPLFHAHPVASGARRGAYLTRPVAPPKPPKI